MRARDLFRWALVAAYAVLWIGGIVTRCAGTASAAPRWAAPVFLSLSATIVAISAGEMLPLVTFAAGGFLAELAGVHTGVPFGLYHYTAVLAPSLGGVPLAIACAWLTLLIWGRDLVWRMAPRPALAVTGAAVLVTSVDLLIDPVATRILHYWHWDQPGIFFGVPLVNFAGWFAVSALLLLMAGKPARQSLFIQAVGLSIVLFFGLIAACG